MVRTHRNSPGVDVVDPVVIGSELRAISKLTPQPPPAVSIQHANGAAGGSQEKSEFSCVPPRTQSLPHLCVRGADPFREMVGPRFQGMAYVALWRVGRRTAGP